MEDDLVAVSSAVVMAILPRPEVVRLELVKIAGFVDTLGTSFDVAVAPVEAVT